MIFFLVKRFKLAIDGGISALQINFILILIIISQRLYLWSCFNK